MYKSGFKKLIAIPLLIILAAGVGFPCLCYGDNPSSSPRAAIPVEATHVIKRDINTFLLYNCTIDAEKQVDIMAKTSGQVEEILVEEGQKVAKNQALARLDEAESLLALKEAKIRYENAKLIHERSQRTYKDNITSKEQLEESRLQYETSMVEYERKKLEYTYNTITSPIDGVVVSRVIEIGSEVEKNQTVFTVADFNPLLARIHVPEKDLNKVKESQQAVITIDSLPGLQFNGRVKMISPVVDPESGTIKVTIEIEYREASPLRPGMFASVYAITERHANALIIPKKALLFETEGAEVFIIKNFAAISLAQQEAEKFAIGDYVKISFSLETNTGVSGIVSEKEASGAITIELFGDSDILAEVTNNHFYIAKADSTDTIQVQDDALHAETRAYKTKVKLGFSEGNDVEVISGLKEGDVIVTVGQEDLGQGTTVKVVTGTETPSPAIARE